MTDPDNTKRVVVQRPASVFSICTRKRHSITVESEQRSWFVGQGVGRKHAHLGLIYMQGAGGVGPSTSPAHVCTRTKGGGNKGILVYFMCGSPFVMQWPPLRP